LEVLYLAEKMGCSIREVAVEYSYFKESTTLTFLWDALQMAVDLVRVRFNYLLKRYDLPCGAYPRTHR
ncbi:MAG: hypothetical protein L0213_14945, partial [Candidatus Dadabacteria bacterium]|nr:hypothetical protein [Candidatus Dadabacteria bacterium]